MEILQLITLIVWIITFLYTLKGGSPNAMLITLIVFGVLNLVRQWEV